MPSTHTFPKPTQSLQADWPVDLISGRKMDPTFFMDLVVFQVDDCLFRIPRVYFENNSLYFKKMYLNPRVEGEVRGSTTIDPIMLEDVKVPEFRDFLTFICPPAAPRDVSGMILTATIRLSTMWRFNRIRASAIASMMQIENTPPFALIWMGLTYTITAFLKKGILGVIRNRTVLNQREKELLESCGASKGIEKLKKGRGWRTASMSMVCEEFKDLIGRMEREEELFGVVAGESTKYVESSAGKGRGGETVLDNMFPHRLEDTMRRLFEGIECTCGRH